MRITLHFGKYLISVILVELQAQSTALNNINFT